MHRNLLPFLALLCGSSYATAAERPDLKAVLSREINGPNLTVTEWQQYSEARVPRVPPVKSAAECDTLAARLRADVLDKVVFRGEAAAWRDAKTKVEWLDTVTATGTRHYDEEHCSAAGTRSIQSKHAISTSAGRAPGATE